MQKILNSKYGEILIRPISIEDIPFQADYFYNSPDEFLTGIGFDIDKRPAREEFIKGMSLRISNSEVPVSVVACLNGAPMAMVVLAPDSNGSGAHAHFHIWDKELRGKGLGSTILIEGLLILMNGQGRDEALIEPHTDNHAMNKLMSKCGFEYVGECVFENPATLSFPAKRYLIKKDLLIK